MPAVLTILAVAALAAEAPASFPTSGLPAPSADELPGLTADLEHGGWNERIHAVEKLGLMGPPARAALTEALNDGDWQVRLTAVHWLGRQGEDAVGPLAAAMTGDPCRVVRLSALQWLGHAGPAALDALKQAQGDANPYMRQSAYYWQSKMDGDGAQEERARANAEIPSLKASQKDNVCASQPGPGRLRRAEPRPAPRVEPALAAVEPSSAPVSKSLEEVLADEPVIAKRAMPEGADASLAAPPPRDARLAELDSLLWEKEDLSTGTAVGRHEPDKAPAELLVADRGAQPKPELSPRGEKESLPDGVFPGPKTPADDDAPAELMKMVDGKAPRDVVPILRQVLKHPNSKWRAWAADELGHLGGAAAPAVPDLSKALADQAARVRASAALALGNVGEAADGAVPGLVRALKDKSADVRDGAALGLFRLGTPRARKAFRRHVREEARRTIERT